MNPNGHKQKPRFGIGPVQSRLLEMLADYSDAEFDTSIAERSPLGPRAIRICPVVESNELKRSTSESLSQWLAQQSWVEAVTARAVHVYLRIRTQTLSRWITSDVDAIGVRKIQPDCEQPLVASCSQSSTDQKNSLHEFREACVRRAIAAMLSAEGDTTKGGAERAITVNCSGVDVPQGRLRAKFGGSLQIRDLVEEIEQGLLRKYSDSGVLNESAMMRKQCAEQSLAFLFLRTERTRRIQLDDTRLQSESAAFERILDVHQIARSFEDGSSQAVWEDTANGERAVQEIAMDIDLLPAVTSRAANELEPATLARYVRSLSERAVRARQYLPAGDPLWLPTTRAIDFALSLIGITVPTEIWETKSSASKTNQSPKPEFLSERNHHERIFS